MEASHSKLDRSSTVISDTDNSDDSNLASTQSDCHHEPIAIEVEPGEQPIETKVQESLIHQQKETEIDDSNWFQGKELSSIKESSDDVSERPSRVTLKRRSQSLAILSSYELSTDSEEEFTKSTFKEPQKSSEMIDSSSDTDSDSCSTFSLDSDDASNESSQSSSEESSVEQTRLRKASSATGVKPKPVFNLLDFGELPPIKDLQISVKEDECLPFGKVHSIVETLVVIESLPDVPALNLDSILFTKSGEPLGEIFDVFGPVKRPYYTIRFKKAKDIEQKSLEVGTTVFCAPKTKYTQYVFVHQLARTKGSDASWMNDVEPPPEFLDYSDDEQERLAKRMLRQSKMLAKANQLIDAEAPPTKKNSFEERMNQRNTLRNQMFIRNPPPDARRPDWYRTRVGPSNDTPRQSGHGLVRPPQFNPIQFQQPRNPRSFFTPNLGAGNLQMITFNPQRPVINSSFRITNPGNQSSMNSGMFSSRPPAIFPPQSNQTLQASSPSFQCNSQAFQGPNQGFQGNNNNFQNGNQTFSANNPSFSGNNPIFLGSNQTVQRKTQHFQGNSNFQANNSGPFPSNSLPPNLPFNQTNAFQQQPNQPFSFSTSPPVFHSQSPQFQRPLPPQMLGTVSGPNVGVPSPFPGFVGSNFETHLRPYQTYSYPAFTPGCSYPPPLHPRSPSPFGASMGRPTTPNSPPALFSYNPAMPPQRSPYPSSPPFPNSSPRIPAFRPSTK